MRIGIDCRTILNPKAGEQAGVGHYTYYLVKNLLRVDKKNEYVLFFDSHAINIEEFKQKNVSIKVFPFFKHKRYLPFSYSHMLVSAFLEKAKLDIYHAPANIIPLKYRGLSVVTVHDLAIYDHPEWFPTKFFTKQIFATKVLVPASLKKAKKIIAVSKNTKKDIGRLFDLPAGKINVIYEGVAQEKPDIAFEQIRKKFGIRKNYLLYVGTLEPRKNIERLINAFRGLMVAKKIDVQLVLAGSLGWNFKSILRAIEDVNKQQKNSLKYLGYVSHQEKLALIKNALCFVFPSLYEGFGLPVLEAMAGGTPVITSRVSSLPEVVGRAGIMIDPEKTGEIAEAILDLVNDKKKQQILSVAGRKQAKKFSWQKTAEETLRVYENVL